MQLTPICLTNNIESRTFLLTSVAISATLIIVKTEATMSVEFTKSGHMVYRNGKTNFVSLPPPAQRPIDGGCHCSFCKANPDRTPMWDTLAFTNSEDAFTVHMPDKRIFAAN